MMTKLTIAASRRPIAFAAVALASALAVHAGTSFEGLDLAEDGRLLFSASTGGDGSPRQSALFVADAATGAVSQLTAFPERMELLEGGRLLQVTNPFGAVRVSASGGLPRPVAGFPSFAAGAAVQGGRTEQAAASPDGRWLLVVDPVTSATGRLVVVDVSKGTRAVVSEGVERPGRAFPAAWSPDSRVFVYSRAGKLYFRSVESSGAIEERYRLIGEGSVASVRWGAGGDFYFVRGSTVYRVRGSELFARALYADFLEIGNVAGRLPLDFDPNFDSFWVAPDASSILLSKGGRNLFYYPLGIDDYAEAGSASLPYLMLPRSCSSLDVLWAPSGIVTVLASFPRDAESPARAYRLSPPAGADGLDSWAFQELPPLRGAKAALSPDGTRALVWGPSGAAVYDYVNWRLTKDLGSEAALSALWLGNEEFLVGTGSRIERFGPAERRTLVCLAAAEDHAFEEGSARILARSGQQWLAASAGGAWEAVASPKARERSAQSKTYRAYLEKQAGGAYENLPMLRNIRGVGTAPLLIRPAAAFEPLADSPSAGEASLDPALPFSNGKRYGRREIALTFDLMDDAAGLPFVLDTLDRFGVKATFFLNGEFIRRHPSAAAQIAEAGHETASLFFAGIDLADAKYKIDAEFVKRGLARNEDEFFNATGKELSLLWHAPYYAASADIAKAAAAVGYRTVGRDVDPLDWMTRNDARRSPAAYKSASEIVDLIMASKRPGSIVPLRLGVGPSGRDDYLFGRLDILADALVRAGYEMVTVSTLMEHSR